MIKSTGHQNTATATLFAATYRRFRGPRVLFCPDGGELVEIELDAAHAASTAVGGGTELRIASCQVWRECAASGCDQACLLGIAPAFAALHGLLVPRRGA